jgi:hypothetical protein
MWFPFTDICLLVGTLKVCWDQEIADYPLQRTNPFKPFKNLPAHVDHSLFLSGQAKLVLGLVKKDEENYYETVVTNAEQSGAVTHTSKQAFHLDSPANIHGVQEFKIGTTEYSPTDKRQKTSSIKVKAVVQLQLCVNLDTAEVSSVCFCYFTLNCAYALCRTTGSKWTVGMPSRSNASGV